MADSTKSVAPASPIVVPEDPPESSLTLPMPCHFAYGKVWHKGTIIQFVVTPLGCQAIVKPDKTNRLTLVELAHLEYGEAMPTGVATA